MNTYYYKASLAQFSSRAFYLFLILQKLCFVAIIIFIKDIVIQLLTMVFFNLITSWIVTSISQIHTDSHLRRFEKINQGFLSLVSISLLLFTDFVYDRDVQFSFGYIYAGILTAFNVMGLVLSILYSLEPFSTCYRLKMMRKK